MELKNGVLVGGVGEGVVVVEGPVVHPVAKVVACQVSVLHVGGLPIILAQHCPPPDIHFHFLKSQFCPILPGESSSQCVGIHHQELQSLPLGNLIDAAHQSELDLAF